MDIAALSVITKQADIQNQTSLLVMKKTMDTASQQAEGLTQMLNAPGLSLPHLGSHIDISA